MSMAGLFGRPRFYTNPTSPWLAGDQEEDMDYYAPFWGRSLPRRQGVPFGYQTAGGPKRKPPGMQYVRPMYYGRDSSGDSSSDSEDSSETGQCDCQNCRARKYQRQPFPFGFLGNRTRVPSEERDAVTPNNNVGINPKPSTKPGTKPSQPEDPQRRRVLPQSRRQQGSGWEIPVHMAPENPKGLEMNGECGEIPENGHADFEHNANSENVEEVTEIPVQIGANLHNMSISGEEEEEEEEEKEEGEKEEEQRQQPSPLETVELISIEASDLKNKVEQFLVQRSDKDYLYLEEMLTRLLLKLDTIDSEGREEVRAVRRSAVKTVQAAIELLENKVKTSKKNCVNSAGEQTAETSDMDDKNSCSNKEETIDCDEMSTCDNSELDQANEAPHSGGASSEVGSST